MTLIDIHHPIETCFRYIANPGHNRATVDQRSLLCTAFDIFQCLLLNALGSILYSRLESTAELLAMAARAQADFPHFGGRPRRRERMVLNNNVYFPLMF